MLGPSPGVTFASSTRSDRTRATSPLTKAEDAFLVDTTGLTIEQVVEQVLRIVEEKMTTLGR